MKKVFSILFISVSILSCSKEMDSEKGSNCSIDQTQEQNKNKVTITQGVYGTVFFTEGNCMPGSVGSTFSCRTCPVVRKVQIYEYTTFSDVTPLSPGSTFFTKVNTKLIREVQTDANGFFEVNLQPGSYSMMVVENGLFYANRSDGQGGIQPISITTGKQNATFDINYKAAF
jgi:hypothetical protein